MQCKRFHSEIKIFLPFFRTIHQMVIFDLKNRLANNFGLSNESVNPENKKRLKNPLKVLQMI